MRLFGDLKDSSRLRAVTLILIGLLVLVTFPSGVAKDTGIQILPARSIIPVSGSIGSSDCIIFAIQPRAEYNSWVSESGNDDSHIKRTHSNDAKASIQTHKVIIGLNQFSTYVGNDGNIFGEDLKSAYLLVDIPPPASVIYS